MQSGKGIGVFATVLLPRPQLAKPRLPPLRDRDLCDQAAQDDLAGKIEPMGRKRIDDIAPNLLFKGIQACRWLRAALPGDDGYD